MIEAEEESLGAVEETDGSEGAEVEELEDEEVIEVEPNEELVRSFNDCAWEDFADDSDDSLIVSFQFLMGRYDNYEDTDILLDTGSTCSVVKNPKMLLNIGDRGRKLRAYTNGGHQDSNEEGDLPGFFRVWYNPRSMLNILSFRDVRKRFRVTVDTSVENAICVHVEGGKVLKFVEVETGLYLLSSKKTTSNKKVSAYSFLTLVRANKNDFTSRQVKRADAARLFRKHLGYPGYRKYFKLLESNYFRNCPVTVDDAKRALHIYGPDVESLKGNSVRRSPLPINELDMVEIPNTLKDLHPTINLSADYFLYKE